MPAEFLEGEISSADVLIVMPVLSFEGLATTVLSRGLLIGDLNGILDFDNGAIRPGKEEPDVAARNDLSFKFFMWGEMAGC